MGSWTRLAEKDAVKGAHFLEVCGHRGLPLISLAHTEPDEAGNAGGDADAEAAALKAKARMMALAATFPRPRLTVVVGDAVGCDYYLMSGRPMSPTFLLAWPNARIAEQLTGGTPPATVDAFKAAGQLWVDDVVRPAETRMHLIALLEIALHNADLPAHEAQPMAPSGRQARCDASSKYWPSYPILRM